MSGVPGGPATPRPAVSPGPRNRPQPFTDHAARWLHWVRTAMENRPRRPSTSPPPFRALGPGAQVASYLIADQIAVGGMATVYEAVHTILPRRVALKVMNGDMLAHPGAIDRLFQEASIVESLAHPGTVRLFEIGLLADRRAWMAMELVEGKTLTEHCNGAALPAAEVMTLLTEITEVLAHAHARNIVHRDLKPDNILVPRDGSRSRLIDWGIARPPAGGRRLTLENATPGTPTYMAPEQARGQHIDGRCDIYALGVVAYEALVGAQPFVGDSAMDIVVQHLTKPPPPVLERRPDAPAGLAALIEMMLTKDVEERPTAAEVHAALRALAGHADADGDGDADSEPVIEILPALEPSLATGSGPVEAGEPAPSASALAVTAAILAPVELEIDIDVVEPTDEYEELLLVEELLVKKRRAITPRSECDEVSGELVIPGH